MAKVIVCYKWVKSEGDIKIDQLDNSVDLCKAAGKISDYDKNAIEAGRKAGEVLGSEVVGLSFGSGDTRLSLKDALSRGLDQAYWVSDSAAETADGFVTSNVLAAAVQKMGDYSLIVCSEGAADTYSHQVGPRLGVLLGIPVISYVSEMKIEDGKITATRKLENYREKVEAKLPALVTVLPEINTAPIPGLKAVVAAGKKPTTEYKAADLGLSAENITRKTVVKDFRGYSMDRKNIIIASGTPEEQVQRLIASLKKEGVL